MSKRLTRWFPKDVKPVRAGVYETREPWGDRWFNYFDGCQWYLGSKDVNKALNVGPFDTLFMEWLASWRGLAKEPK